ncbi:MAG: Ribosomal protein large subunit ribosomal protein [Candidatus Parcubacteria bacterium]|jgi:large subunit ribosomal protein L3
MKFLLGTKENMTQIFTEDGVVVPVTVIKTSANVITQVKTSDKDGYQAVQIGFGEKKAKNVTKPLKGHVKELGNFAHLKEVKLAGEFNIGDKIEVGTLTEGDTVTVSAISKGKGFQGVVKRHGFKGGRRSHGQKHSEREPGSIGVGGVQRVFKGMRMAGRMGADRVTVKNLTVAKVDADNQLVYIKGAVPGRKGTLVEIKG